MYTLPDHFDKLLTNILPRKNRSEMAKTIPGRVRDYLKETDLLKTVYPQSRLAGSYGRSTATKNIKDVDILVFLNPEYKTDKDKQPTDALNHLINALQDLPEHLGNKNGIIDAEPAIRRQRRSVHLTFTLSNDIDQIDETFELDIVPVVALDGLDNPLWVPDWDWSKWIETDPLGYGKSLSVINHENSSKVVPLIRMLKHWRDERMIYRRPKSYWLECMTIRSIRDGQIEFGGMSYAEIFTNLLGTIYENYAPYFSEENAVPIIPDPMLENNVAWNWERAEFETFMRRVNESLGWAKRALECDTEADAVDLWQKVFNHENDDEYFPTTVEDEAKAIAAARSAGTLRVTSSGTLLIGTTSEKSSVQSPPHQFYGKESN